MSLEIDVRHNLKGLKKKLNRIQRRQIPFATHQALNDTAFDARKALMVQVEKKLDRPTAFTKKGFKVNRSPNKRLLIASIEIPQNRWRYMKYQVLGGMRPLPRNKTALPTNFRLNRFGNIPGRKRGLIKNNRQFIARIRGVEGIWERYGNGRTKLMAAFERKVEYQKRFPFRKIVQGVVNSRLPKHLNTRLKRALQTAK